ncbi:hypothetical protein Syun_009447 [Stephania yunnanensis]|uniref:Uncharacterized protein n=1 Tax=Stephania yunnanensis TaxID=152371 RepID=A0AAP0KEI7_9MAGN
MNYIFVTIDTTLCEHSVSDAKTGIETPENAASVVMVSPIGVTTTTPQHMAKQQINTVCPHTSNTVPPSSTTCLLHPNSPPPSPPTPTRTYTHK